MEFLQLMRGKKATTHDLNGNTSGNVKRVARVTIIYGLNVRDCYVT